MWGRAIDKPYDNYLDIGRNAKEVNKKLTGFLEFQYQRTEGLPCLLPLYAGLRMRCTETIKKNSEVTFVKHTLGIVVGWHLDATYDHRLCNSIPHAERRWLTALTNVVLGFVPSRRSSWAKMFDGIVAVTLRQRIWS